MASCAKRKRPPLSVEALCRCTGSARRRSPPDGAWDLRAGHCVHMERNEGSTSLWLFCVDARGGRHEGQRLTQATRTARPHGLRRRHVAFTAEAQGRRRAAGVP